MADRIAIIEGGALHEGQRVEVRNVLGERVFRGELLRFDGRIGYVRPDGMRPDNGGTAGWPAPLELMHPVEPAPPLEILIVPLRTGARSQARVSGTARDGTQRTITVEGSHPVGTVRDAVARWLAEHEQESRA